MSRKTFKYRLYPNRQQRERLQTTLDVCRELYDAARQERRDGYRTSKAKLNYCTQDIFNRRNDFQHKESLKIVQTYGTIFVEDLNVGGLSRGILSKSVHDASWTSFLNQLSYKAENAGRRFVQVDPRGTSQRCVCGRANRKKLSDREHVCVACGLATTRDHASALEIQRLGQSLQASTIPELGCVA
jgi:putative transposase